MTRGFLLVFLVSLCGCTAKVKAPVLSGDRPTDPPVAAEPAEPAAEPGIYIVRRGDTLYSIAWKYSRDYRTLADWNNITPPYTIFPGQRIRLQPSVTETASGQNAQSPARRQKQEPATRDTRIETLPEGRVPVWQWPTPGRIVRIQSPTLEKGTNIAGREGQAIHAAAAGRVVYSGSGLLGYGKLIIIKHNETYLSAYAHNKEILTREGSNVAMGEQIATMGVAGDGMPILHFEIRKDGKPVDPIKYLPKQDS